MARPDVTCWGMLPTPFGPGGESIDIGSLRRLTDHYLSAGCDGVIVLGVVGEPETLTRSEKRVIVETVAASGRPVVGGVMAGTAAEAVVEAATLAHDGAQHLDALLVPVLVSQAQALRTWLEDLHDATGLPLMVQDLPQRSGVHVGVDELGDAIEGLGFVRGVKCEASPSYLRIARLHERGIAGLMSGFGGLGLVPDLVAGATQLAVGVTVPRPVVDAARAWSDGDDQAALDRVGSVAGRISFETQPGPSIAIRKEHLRREGLIACADVRSTTTSWSPGLEPITSALGVGNSRGEI